MRIDWALGLVTLLTAVSAAGIDPTRHVERIDSNAQTDEQDLYKRRGGGGGGGRGGGGSRGGGSRGGGSSGGGGSRGGSGGSGGGGRTGPAGPGRSYGGGGASYGGGAQRPFRAGGRSPGRGAIGGVAAIGLLGVAALAFWPGTWYGGAYMYRYGREDNDSDNTTYTYYNITTDEQEERDILCGCAENADCGCEPNDDVMEELVGNGSYAALNKSIINVGRENGTDFFLINGTLPEGTVDAVEQEEEDEDDAGNSMKGLVEALGFWPATAAVACAVLLA